MKDNLISKVFYIWILLPGLVSLGLNLWPHQKVLQNALFAAHLAEVQNNNSQKVASYLEIVSVEPWRSELWLSIANAEMAAGHWNGAVSAFEMAKRLGRFSICDESGFGEALFRNGQLARAVESWRVVIDNGSATPEIFRKMVDTQRDLGDFAGVIETLHRWILEQPEELHPKMELAMYLAATQPDDALSEIVELQKSKKSPKPPIDNLEKALRNNQEKDRSKWRVDIGRALAGLDYWDLAAVSFHAATDINPENAEAWAYLGEAYQHAGQSGWSELERAFGLNPDSVVVLSLMAMYYRRNDNPGKALEYLGKIASEEPDQAIWQVEIGLTLAQKGDLPAALEYFRKAVQLRPESAQFWRLLAGFCAENYIEVRETGLPAARRAVSLSPDDPESYETLGWIFFRLGDNISAEKFLKQSIDIDNTRPSAALRLGQIYLDSGDMANAQQNLTRAAVLADKNSEVYLITIRLLDRYFGGYK